MITTIDPSTEDVIERFEYMTAREVAEKLDAATAGAARWRSTDMDERAAKLRNVAIRLRERRDELATIAVREMGKPLSQARAEVEKCASVCEFFAANAATMLADQDAPSNAALSYVAFRPLGVVLAIMPWNFPYWQVFRAAAPALMAGNSVVLKHADNTTRCALEIEHLFTDAGFPADAFITLLIDTDHVDRLIPDPRIAAVTLTGSERAGVAVASAAGSGLKKCVLELGGSDAFVVLADADLAAAAKTAIASRFQNTGQSCIAAKRFIVEETVYDEFLERFATLARAQRVGNPLEDGIDIGPSARKDLRDGVHNQVLATVDAGAKLVTGGRPLERRGFFYEPTVVGDVVPGMRMFDEEVFGPAAAVVRAKDVDDAIALANRSSYGLGFNIWTRDTSTAQALASRVEAGGVFINGMTVSDPRLPFGGVKKSGYGRELSHFGIHEFVNVQTVWIGNPSS